MGNIGSYIKNLPPVGCLMKIAVITPYFDERLNVLERCHESVARQCDLREASITHFFIADGKGLKAVDNLSRVRHIRLGVSHNDNGNTPRAVGGLCALREGFEAIFYLDADNLYDNLHVSSVIKVHEQSGSEAIFSSRYWFFPDGDCYDFAERHRHEDRLRRHVDTSCISLFSSARGAVGLWGQMPASLGPICDRVFFQYLITNHTCSWTDQKTVFFETWYAGSFRPTAIPTPRNAKTVPRRTKDEWLADFQQFARHARIPVPIQVAPVLIKPPHQRIRLLQISSTAEMQPSNLISSLSQIHGFISDPQGAWDRYLIEKFPELKAIDLQGVKDGDDVAGLLQAAKLLNDQVSTRLLSDLAPHERKHLLELGRLTICTSLETVVTNVVAALKQAFKLENLVIKKILFVGPPTFFTDSADEETNPTRADGDVKLTGRGDTKFISRSEVDRYCEAISSTAVGCAPREVLMIPAIYRDTKPIRVLLKKIEQFVDFLPGQNLPAPSRKVFNLKELFDFFSANDRYTRELTAINGDIRQGLEGILIENSPEKNVPSLENDQNYEWSRVHHSFWQHREDFAPFFDIPAPAQDPKQEFKVIRSVERAAQILGQRKEMAMKYSFI